MKSAAVVNFSPEIGSVEIREIDKPQFGDDEVLLEVPHVGVCGSDLHQWTVDHSWPVWERVITLLASGQLDVSPLIDGDWPLEKWHEAFEKMHDGTVVKSILKPV